MEVMKILQNSNGSRSHGRIGQNKATNFIEISAKHRYLPTTLTTDKRTALTSLLVAEIAQILGIHNKSAALKSPIGKLDPISKLEKTHAGFQTNSETASEEYRRQWFLKTCK